MISSMGDGWAATSLAVAIPKTRRYQGHEFAIGHGQDLVELLGPLAGASFTIDMQISEPNQNVEVEAPSDALPFEELVQP
jgi:hypothetical protein